MALLISLAIMGCVPNSGNGMVEVHGGMYSPLADTGGPVQIDDLYWTKEPITVGEWHDFVVAAYPQFSFKDIAASAESSMEALFGDSRWPMQSVTWYEAVLYCNWRSKVEGLEPAYECSNDFPFSPISRDIVSSTPYVRINYRASGYRLPTSIEWEYAARGGLSGIAERWDATLDFLQFGFFIENSEKHYHPVGHKKPNPQGLYDMVGLVGEWCWDGETNSSEEAFIGEAHIFRGGSIFDSGTKGFGKRVDGFVVEGSGRPEFFSHPRYSPGLGRGAIGFRIVRRIVAKD